jgi:ABC-type siderophore export system fused ATPase/permease subunit
MGFFSDIFSSGASSLVTAVGDAIDKNVTSDEERKELDNEISKANMQFQVQMATLGLQEQQAYLADANSARDNQSRVQESEHSSWLAKNVHSFLAISIIGLTFFMYWYIAFSDESANKIMAPNSPMKDIVIYILGALTTVATQVVSYFFGSSAGSADKSKALNAILKKG